jgi:hypothetical protein
MKVAPEGVRKCAIVSGPAEAFCHEVAIELAQGFSLGLRTTPSALKVATEDCL